MATSISSSRSGPSPILIHTGVSVAAFLLAVQLLCLHAGAVNVTALASDSHQVVPSTYNVNSVGPVLWEGSTLNAGQSLTDDLFGNQGSSNSVLAMQTDCNLVVEIDGRAAWASGTQNAGTGCYLKMQTDGNLVIYDMNGAAVWASQTADPAAQTVGPYFLAFQLDHNAVVYQWSTYKPVWATNTANWCSCSCSH